MRRGGTGRSTPVARLEMSAAPVYIDLEDDFEISDVQNAKELPVEAAGALNGAGKNKNPTRHFDLSITYTDSISSVNIDNRTPQRVSTGKEHHLEFLDLLGVNPRPVKSAPASAKRDTPSSPQREIIDLDEDDNVLGNISNTHDYWPNEQEKSLNDNDVSDVIVLDQECDQGTPKHAKDFRNMRIRFPASSPTHFLNGNNNQLGAGHNDDNEVLEIKECVRSPHSAQANMHFGSSSPIVFPETQNVPLPFPTVGVSTSQTPDRRKRSRSSSSIGPVTILTPRGREKTASNSLSLKPFKMTTGTLHLVKPVKDNKTQKVNKENLQAPPQRKSSRHGTAKIFDTEKNISRTPSSDLSDFSSSMHELHVNLQSSRNTEFKKGTEAIDMMKRQKMARARTLKLDLAKERANVHLTENMKHKQSVNKVLNSAKNRPPITAPVNIADDFSNISNSSTDLNPPPNFMENVIDGLEKFSEERLELLFQRTKDIEPTKLKNANRTNFTKEELTGKMTCLFSTCLDEKLKSVNADYASHITSVKFDKFKDNLPLIKFSRYTDSIFYSKRSSFVPIAPEQLEEKFIVLVYEAQELIPLFKDKILREDIKTLKRRYPKYKLGVWFLGYRDYMQKLKTEYNRSVQKEAQAKLNALAGSNTENNNEKSSRKKKTIPEQPLSEKIRPHHIEERIRKYEIEHQVYFELFKGLKEMISWLVAYAYTLSCKHIDVMEKNNDIANIGRISSKMNPRDATIGMLAQLKGLREDKARKMVEKQNYQCIADVYHDVLKNVDFSGERLLNTNHDTLIKKLLTSTNPSERLV